MRKNNPDQENAHPARTRHFGRMAAGTMTFAVISTVAAMASPDAPLSDSEMDTRVLVLLGLFVFFLIAVAWGASRWMGKASADDNDDWTVPFGVEKDEFDRDER
ncbi:hypothetical protein [Parvularcula sp. LCG005]|uniref:hypothetical protein n=1 Tax=Parvularcula sp. LCG005 TaxID=3078805 RepID=UPI002943E4D8|nr:hypothetical protein [Parvularcula sp. LCG005]WOI52655.1 hypothetical protein RUI03_10900 [Parvularcula sp. LCG005]